MVLRDSRVASWVVQIGVYVFIVCAIEGIRLSRAQPQTKWGPPGSKLSPLLAHVTIKHILVITPVFLLEGL